MFEYYMSKIMKILETYQGYLMKFCLNNKVAMRDVETLENC